MEQLPQNVTDMILLKDPTIHGNNISKQYITAYNSGSQVLSRGPNLARQGVSNSLQDALTKISSQVLQL